MIKVAAKLYYYNKHRIPWCSLRKIYFVSSQRKETQVTRAQIVAGLKSNKMLLKIYPSKSTVSQFQISRRKKMNQSTSMSDTLADT